MTAVIAFLALFVSLGTFVVAGRRTRLDRQRQVFADAFEAVMEYREFPFMVRRRNSSKRDEERTRLGGELSRVQARMNSYKARLLIEDPYIGKLYAELVRQTRLHAGAHSSRHGTTNQWRSTKTCTPPSTTSARSTSTTMRICAR
jgi:hypothetical protein